MRFPLPRGTCSSATLFEGLATDTALGTYTFTSQEVPETRAALGLDDEAVQRAYRCLYRVSLETLDTHAPR
jgi:hypothetical protein